MCSLLSFYSCKETAEVYPVVEIEDVSRDNIEIHGYYVGSIRAYRNVEIHARVEGFLEKMTFEEGKRIEKGEPLFYINNDVYKARVERARAQLKKDEAMAAKAERDEERLRPLYQQNAASRLDLDNAVAAKEMAEASVAMSKADLAQAELELSYTVVRSPLTGYISERHVDVFISPQKWFFVKFGAGYPELESTTFRLSSSNPALPYISLFLFFNLFT